MKTSTGKTGREALEPADGDMLTAQEATAELRVLRQRIVQVTTLSKKERKAIWQRGDISIPVTQASITIIDANETVAQALKTPAADVRTLIEEADYWDAFVVELRGLMQGVSDANLVRRERIAILAAQAYAIGLQLARDPANEGLQQHLDAVRRLKRLGRRRRRSAAAEEAVEPAAGTNED
jgi:hypothetical protein